MLRTTFLAATLLAMPVAALADGGYHGHGAGYSSRVVVAEPNIAVSIGAPLNGFNLYYQSGGYRYVPVAPVYYRAPVVVRAPYYPVQRVLYYPSRNDWHGDERHHRHHDNDRRGHERGREWDD
jgi:hypothetical protein